MKQFMPDLSNSERVTILQENAQKVEETTYQRPLTEEELSAKREDLADNCIFLNQKEDEFKEVKDRFKVETEPYKRLNKILLQEIKTKQSTVEGILYHLPNHEDGMMETYDGEGYMIGSRRLRPDERQGNIFSFSKAQNL